MKRIHIDTARSALLAACLAGAGAAWSAGTFDPAKQPFGDVPQLALTGFNLSTGTQKAFQVYFDPTSWAGDVSAYPIGTDGRTQIANKIWSAFDVFRSRQACGNGTTFDPTGSDVNYFDTGRNIVTRNASANIAFRWPVDPTAPTSSELSSTQITALKAGGTDTDGQKRLNYVRGDRANEKYQQVLQGDGSIQSECGISTGVFRARVSILGDALHTRPVFVGAPPADYTFDSYQTFKTANAGRPTRLFVGSNDGMVHAFDASDGSEVWAYIPSMLVANLPNLSTDPYTHTYFVDGAMTAGDVNFGTTVSPDWRTVIVGGLGAGGKGLFALDVTSADAADETQAKAKILWEITPASTNFGSLGYTYGTPVIARMNTGQWAVIVGNGYLNTGTGTSVLYIIDIKTGLLIKSLDTSSGTLASPNGLSTPTAIDTTFDGKIDRIYAGDIDGNMWKFDVGATTSTSWTAPTAALFPTSGDLTANTPAVTKKAILGAPDVAAHPISGFLVFFATGRLLTGGTSSDATDSTVVNYAYGIWDGAPAANTTLLTQSLTEKTYDTQRVRVSSGLSINWNDSSDTTNNPMRKGWRTALPAGERVIGSGFVRDARFQFTGVNPTIAHTPTNGENWLIELDYLTGGAADKPIFDLSADSLLSDTDRVFAADGTTRQAGTTGIPVAVYMGAGLLSQPVLANVSAQLSTTLFNDNPSTSPADQPADPPPPSAERGVAGGHFDVDIYYPAAGGKNCTYTSTGTAAKAATGKIAFTYSSNKSANTLSIKFDGVEIIDPAQNLPGSKSKSGLASYLGSTSRYTAAFLADWTPSVSSSTVIYTAKATGTAWNGIAITVSTGSGMTSSNYTITTPTSGGAAAVPGVDTMSSCVSKKHFHEYDEIFNVTGVNFLAPSDTTLDIKNAITDTATNFKVLIHNQYLSPAVTFSIGGAPFVSVKDYGATSTLTVASLPTYNRGNVATMAVNMPVDAFSLKNWWGDTPADTRSGLHPTSTGCVKDSSGSVVGGHQNFEAIVPPANGTNGPGTNPPSPPGTAGARHNGALVVQVIKDTTPDSAIEQNIPGRPEYGWRVKGGDSGTSDYETYVLAEWTVFWHHPTTPCYGGAGWTKEPAPDLSAPDSSKFKTPAAGSSDPGAGTSRVTITSTSSTTTTDASGNQVTTTTTNYSNGGQLVVTTTTTPSGTTTTTSQYVPASSGGGSSSTTTTSATGVGQAVSSPNTVTGYQQTRNSGKLGRVTWHELFRQ